MQIKTPNKLSSGFTLIEGLIVLVVSGILIIILAQFFKNFNKSFNLQEQVADRDLNGQYAIRRLSETLMAAGANLPNNGWPVLELPIGNPGTKLKVSINPRGAIEYATSDIVNTNEIPISDPKGFAKATSILIQSTNPATPIATRNIDLSYKAGGFNAGIKAVPPESLAVNPTLRSYLRLTAPVTIGIGDVIYAHAVEVYSLQNHNLMLDSSVLAENFDTLTFSLFTSAKTLTSTWADMRSANINVKARTRNPDPSYKINSGYRTLPLSMDILLRNKL